MFEGIIRVFMLSVVKERVDDVEEEEGSDKVEMMLIR